MRGPFASFGVRGISASKEEQKRKSKRKKKKEKRKKELCPAPEHIVHGALLTWLENG